MSALQLALLVPPTVMLFWAILLLWRLVRVDQIEYEKMRARFPSFVGMLLGQTRVKRDTVPDGRVRAGIVYNKKEGRIEPQGKLNDDVIDRILY